MSGVKVLAVTLNTGASCGAQAWVKGRASLAGSVSLVHQDSCEGASKNSCRQSLAVSSGESTVKPIVRGSLKIS